VALSILVKGTWQNRKCQLGNLAKYSYITNVRLFVFAFSLIRIDAPHHWTKHDNQTFIHIFFISCLFLVIFTTMGVSSGGLQCFIQFQIQSNIEEKTWIEWAHLESKMLEKNALNLIFKPRLFLILSNVKRCGCVNLGSIIHFWTAKTIELWPRILKLQTLALLKQTFVTPN